MQQMLANIAYYLCLQVVIQIQIFQNYFNEYTYAKWNIERQLSNIMISGPPVTTEKIALN